MKVFIDGNRCEGTAYCRAVVGEVFELGEDDVARLRVDQDGPELDEHASEVLEAQDLCPTAAISVVTDAERSTR